MKKSLDYSVPYILLFRSMEPIHIEIDIDLVTDAQVGQAMQKIANLANLIAAHYLIANKRTANDPAVQSIMIIANHAEGTMKYLAGQNQPQRVVVPELAMSRRPS